MKFHHADVTTVQQLTPGMIRVTLAGEGLTGWKSTGVGDEYVRTFFPPGEDRTEVPLPIPTEKGWEWPEGETSSPMRNYTIRAHRPETGEVDIDFVVHDGGVAAAWALEAAPGERIGINTPAGLYEAPDDLKWQLLVADQTGLPAALRLAETAPTGVRTRVVLEVPDAEHEQPCGDPNAEIRWVHGGNGHGPSRLDEIVRASLSELTGDEGELPGGYVWVAGETKVLRAVRKHLRHELKLPSTPYKVVGYWTERAEEWRERFQALDDTVRAELSQMWSEDRDKDEIEDDYTAKLESLGL